MTDLSPAAQAVLNAANTCNSYGPDDCLNESRWIAAAALRAAVDQVAPEGRVYMETVTDAGVFVSTKPPARFRSKLLAIAAELEGFNG